MICRYPTVSQFVFHPIKRFSNIYTSETSYEDEDDVSEYMKQWLLLLLLCQEENLSINVSMFDVVKVPYILSLLFLNILTGITFHIFVCVFCLFCGMNEHSNQ